jgi:hypothetical protein
MVCLLVRMYARVGGCTLLSFSADIRCCHLEWTYGGPPPDVRSDK